MYCRYCGKKTDNTDAICSDCAKSSNNGTAKTKKKNGTKVMVGILLLLLLIAAATIICVLLSQKQSPEEKVTENINVLLESSKERIDSESVGAKIAEQIIGDMTFEVVSIRDDIAVIAVLSPDVSSVYLSVIQSMENIEPTSEDEYDKLVNLVLSSVSSELENGNYEKRNTEVEVKLTEDYQIEMSYEFVDAVYGGLLSLQEQLINEYTGGAA